MRHRSGRLCRRAQSHPGRRVSIRSKRPFATNIVETPIVRRRRDGRWSASRPGPMTPSLPVRHRCRLFEHEPAKHVSGSGSTTHVASAATSIFKLWRATLPCERKILVEACVAIAHSALGTERAVRSTASPATSPPPNVLVKIQAALPGQFRGASNRNGLWRSSAGDDTSPVDALHFEHAAAGGDTGMNRNSILRKPGSHRDRPGLVIAPSSQPNHRRDRVVGATGHTLKC